MISFDYILNHILSFIVLLPILGALLLVFVSYSLSKIIQHSPHATNDNAEKISRNIAATAISDQNLENTQSNDDQNKKYEGSKLHKKPNINFIWGVTVALVISLLELYLAFLLLNHFDLKLASMQFTESHMIFGESFIPELRYSLGIDGISIYFILLNAFLTPICILIGLSSSTRNNFCIFAALLLLLEGIIMCVFTVTNLILFYVAFEAVLIPMFLIIGIWGGERKIYATFKFFLYTLFGSVFMLIATIFVVFVLGFQDVNDFTSNSLHNLQDTYATLLWFGFFIAFAVKMPMFPFHTWLPDAHVQAPTAGSVILAAILLKLGGYGFLRILLPLLPTLSMQFANFVILLSIIAIVYTSMVALMQNDMKKMIAYSSVAHMGYVTAGIFTFSNEGINGAIIQMISHGLISAALFTSVGVLYDRAKTKEIAFYGGLAHKMPKFAFWFMIFTMASIALPGTSGFIGEILVLIALFQSNSNLVYGIIATLGMVLSAAYMLWLYKRLMLGKLKKSVMQIFDLDLRERFLCFIFAIFIILVGFYPKIITDYTNPAVKNLLIKLE